MNHSPLENTSVQQIQEVITDLVRQNQKAVEDIRKSEEKIQLLQNLITQRQVWKPFVAPNDYRDLLLYVNSVYGERYIAQVGYKKAAEQLTQEVDWVVETHNLSRAYRRNCKKGPCGPK